MKNSIVSLALLSAFMGSAWSQTNVTIYGIADAGVRYDDNDAASNGKKWSLGSGLQSGSRFGFRGREDLGGGLSALFVLENGFNIDDGQLRTGNTLFDRQAWLGLSGSFGTLKLGRQYAPIRVAVESIDPFGLGGAGNAANFLNVHGERTDNTLNYTTANLGGFSGQVAYSFGEVAGNNSAGRNLGLSAGYASGAFTVVTAYHARELLASNGTTPNGDEKTVMVGGTYDLGLAKLHAAYSRSEGETAAGVTNLDRNDVLIGITAPIGAGSILVSYNRRSDDIAGTGGTSRDASRVALGYLHTLSKRTNLYAMYARTSNDAGVNLNGGAANGADPSTVMVGVRHRF